MTHEQLSAPERLFRKEALAFPAYLLSEQPNCIRLHQNESHFLSDADRVELAEVLTAALRRPGGVNHYPALLSERLLNAYARHLGVLPDQIEVTAGSSQALTLIAEAFFGSERRVALTQPSFSLYASLAGLYSTQVTEICLNEHYEFCAENLLNDRVLSADVAIICSPNNPTGTLCDVKLIVEFADRFRGVLVVDEAYIEFANQSDKQSFICEAVQRENVIVLRTLSKAWAAAGLRVGGLISNREIIRVMRALKPPYSIAWPSEILATHLLENKGERVGSEVVRVRQRRDALASVLRECSNVSFVSDSQANFVFFKTRLADALENQMKEAGFIIRRYKSETLQHCVRISIPPESDFEHVVEIIRRTLH